MKVQKLERLERLGYVEESRLNGVLKLMMKRAGEILQEINSQLVDLEYQKSVENFVKITESALRNQYAFNDQIATLKELEKEGIKLNLYTKKGLRR